MLKQLPKPITRFLEASSHHIILTIVTSIIGVPVLVSWATGTIDVLIQTIKSPTPLWATISLALVCCGYIYVKLAITNGQSTENNKSSYHHENIKDVAPSPRHSDIMLSMLGGNIFIPNAPGAVGHLTGIGLNVKIWNIGAPSVVTEWSLFVIPKNEIPVIAQLTEMPESLRVGGINNSAVIRSQDSLESKTKITPVETTPIEGTLLFYVPLQQEIVLMPSTRLELIAKDINGKETKSTKTIGDWMSY